MSFLEKVLKLGQELAQGAESDAASLGLRAADALRAGEFHRCFSEEEVLEALAKPGVLPEQVSRGLGRPSIMLFRHPFFTIRVEYRVAELTMIHNHTFQGAYQVLRGKGLYSSYDFICDRPLAEGVDAGRLNFRRAELLQDGDTGVIGGTHHVCNLTVPQINLRIRTNRDQHERTYQYLPHILRVIEMRDATPEEERVRETLSLLCFTRDPLRQRFLQRVVEKSPLYRALMYLIRYVRTEGNASEIPAILQGIPGREPLIRILEGVDFERMALEERLRSVGVESVRVLHALATMVPEPGAMDRVLTALVPGGDPAGILTEFLRQSGLVDHLNDTGGRFLSLFLEGKSDEEASHALSREYGIDDVASVRRDAAGFRATLEEIPLIRRLLKVRSS